MRNKEDQDEARDRCAEYILTAAIERMRPSRHEAEPHDAIQWLEKLARGAKAAALLLYPEIPEASVELPAAAREGVDAVMSPGAMAELACAAAGGE